MSRIKKLGVPADIAPTFDIIDRIADGGDIGNVDLTYLVKSIGLVQYYLKGKLDGLKIKKLSDKVIASELILDCQKELNHVLEILTDTE